MSAQDDPSSPPYKRILVPYDGSEMSDRALKHASRLAKMTDAEIVILHVIENEYIPTSALVGFIQPDEELLDAKERLRASLESKARKMVEEKARGLGALGIRVSQKVIPGDKPSDEIVRESEEGVYDLIVMASSRMASSIRVLGSNALRVINSVRKPVLLIHE